MRKNWGETAMGFAVLAFALLFVVYAVRVGGGYIWEKYLNKHQVTMEYITCVLRQLLKYL